MLNNTKIWFYLLKRDKSGVRFITQFSGRKIPATRLKNLKDLNLPIQDQEALKKIIYESRLNWEPWLESIDSFDVLRDKLKIRGYKNIPMSYSFEYDGINYFKIPQINTNNIKSIKTMLRRN